MKNLVKNVVRSFKNNKISLIGLIFLLFFGLGTFCTMSNTTSNISSQYNSIAKKGNLHDFTASELYEVGNAAYVCKNAGFEYTNPLVGEETYTPKDNINKLSTQLYAGEYQPEASSTAQPYFFVVPTQTVNTEKTLYTRIYNLELSPDYSTGLYKEFALSQAPETKLEIKITEEVEGEDVPFHITAIDALQKPISEWTNELMDQVVKGTGILLTKESGNALHADYNKFLQAIEYRTNLIFNMITTQNTPLSAYLDSKYKDEITYRRFNSINVTASKDNIFYKVIKSNPTDTINKIVLFKDPKGNYGHNLFNETDWAPFNSQINFVDQDGQTLPAGTVVGHLTVPSTFEELIQIEPFSYEDMSTWTQEEKYLYSQMMHIRFKRMYSGDLTTAHKTIEDLLSVLSSVNTNVNDYHAAFWNESSEIYQNYDSYMDHRGPDSWDENIIVSMNGNIVVNWNVPTPLSCTMVNWTSHFSVVNPQHLSATSKQVIDHSSFTNFEPFKQWYIVQYGKEPKDTIEQEVITAWLNTLTNKQFNFWWRPEAMTGYDSMKYTIYKKDGSSIEVTVTKGTQEGQWAGISNDSIVSCGGYYQIIWGCGLSPDFMYPVVDITRPTPNVKTECLTYCNNSGYKALRLAFFNSPTEDFLVAKFMPSVTTTRQQEIINDLNRFCSEKMLYPKDIKAVYRANDQTNVLNSSAFRVAYIPNLVNVIQLITIILSIFLAILSLVICLIIIKRYVENNRVNIGIMRANGISKMKIALSLLPFALLPAIIGGIGAYLVGLFLQIPMLKLFGNYWTLPTPIMAFDWVSMVACVFIPFILFGIITILSALWVLRTKSVELMKAGSEFKTNSFSKVAKKPFKHFGVMTRFRVALAFNSLSRLIMLALMSCLTMTSLVFAMTSFGKLNQSQVINSSQFDYSFNLQLTTPTTAGGTYQVEDWSQHGLGYTDPNNYIFNTSWDHSTLLVNDPQKNLTKWYSDSVIGGILKREYREAIGENGNLMLPTMADASGQKEDLQYLLNKTCSKLTLDYVIGLGSLSSNPWEIAIALMPANSRNLASSSYNTIVSKVGAKIDAEDPEWVDYKDFFTQDEEGKLVKPYSLDVSTKSWLTGFTSDYVEFLVKIYNTPELIADEYRISYGIIPTNWTYGVEQTKKDELYSYITGPITAISSTQRPSFDKTHDITIEGIADNSQFIKLTDNKGNSLNKVLFEEAAKQEENRPIIINAFTAHKYNLGIGSTFTVVANNTADRYDRQINPEYDKQDKSNQCTFKVVGISQGTNGEAFYCTQLDANNVLGLPNGTTWNKTHKYMLWQDKPGLILDTEKRVIDLSDIGDKEGKNYVVYQVGEDGKLTPEEEKVERFEGLEVPVGFNGIYTADKSGRPLTSSLSLYSYSGLYPGSSVFNSKSMQTLLANGNNLALANFMSGINNKEVCDLYAQYMSTGNEEYLNQGVDKLISLLRQYFGDTTMVTCICGVTDVAASDLIYKNLISTVNLAETTIMSVIIPITIIVVGIISNLIINDSKKMAAMLKALGYSDRKNAMSILALFVPTIILGLALAIPATMGICTGYQAIVFGSANILIDVTRKWWYYVASVGGIGVILVATYVVGWASLKRDRLVDRIKN